MSEDNEQTRKARSYLGSFVPRLGPSKSGPCGKEWTHVDVIVVAAGNFIVVDTSKPLISVGKMTSMGRFRREVAPR